MKKTMVSLAALGAMMFVGSAAMADDHKMNTLGAQMDVGVPGGMQFVVLATPDLFVKGNNFYWLKAGVGIGYTLLAPTLEASIVLDPIKFPIRLYGGLSYGHAWEGDPSSLAGKQLPTFSYDYLTLSPTLAFGSNNGFTFFLAPGLTYMNIKTGNFQSVLNKSDVLVSDPHVSGWVFPTAKIGFQLMFL